MLIDIFANLDDVESNELMARIDAWAIEVMTLRSDTYKPDYDPFGRSVVLDDLFGSYIARDRLQRFPGASELPVVKAIDALLVSITEDRGRGWIALTGMQENAGQGWWWSRVPLRAARPDEFNIEDEAR